MKNLNSIRKTVIILSLFVFCSLHAQTKFKLGLETGAVHNKVDYNLSNRVLSKYDSRWGHGSSIFAEYNFYKQFVVSLGLSYLQKNYQFKRFGRYEGTYTKYASDYINVPLLIGGYLLNNPYESKGIWIKISGGGYIGYWASLKRKGNYFLFSELTTEGEFPLSDLITEKYDFDKNINNYERFEYGIQGQFQLGYSFNQFDVFGSYAYLYGLSGILKNENENTNLYNRSSMISIGVSHKF